MPIEKIFEARARPLSERSEDADVGRHSMSSNNTSDGTTLPRFSKRIDYEAYEAFTATSSMNKRLQELPDGFVEQVASAVASTVEVQFHDLTETLLAAIRAAYHQESVGHVKQLSSQVAAALTPELTKALTKACAHLEHTHSRPAAPVRQAAPCLTAVSRYSSASKSCSSFTSSSKSSARAERDARAVADGLAEETLKSQGLMSSSSTDARPAEAWKTRRQHDPSDTLLSFVLPEESEEPKQVPVEAAALEFESEDFQIQSLNAHASQKHDGKLLPGELGREESKLACSINTSEIGHGRKPSVQTAVDVLQVRVQELTEEIVYQDDEAELDAEEQEQGRPSFAFSKLGGIVGWSNLEQSLASRVYQSSVLLFACLASIYVTCAWLITPVQPHMGHSMRVERTLFLSDIAMAVGSSVGFFLMRPWNGSAMLCNTLSLLHAYSHRMGLVERWRKRVKLETWVTYAVWSLVIGSAWAGLFLHASWTEASTLLNGISLTIISTVLICLCAAVQHVCHHLLMFVDAFCCAVSEEREIDRISHDWNILQAVLRKSASSIEYCFVWIQSTIALAVPLAIADLAVYGVCREVVVMLVPRCVLLLYVLRTLLSAASLTSKCDNVPSVINALHFGLHTDSLRQHTVNYISNSAAGFHVCQIRLTMGMAIKYVYIWSVVAFALFTQLFVA